MCNPDAWSPTLQQILRSVEEMSRKIFYWFVFLLGELGSRDKSCAWMQGWSVPKKVQSLWSEKSQRIYSSIFLNIERIYFFYLVHSSRFERKTQRIYSLRKIHQIQSVIILLLLSLSLLSLSFILSVNYWVKVGGGIRGEKYD